MSVVVTIAVLIVVDFFSLPGSDFLLISIASSSDCRSPIYESLTYYVRVAVEQRGILPASQRYRRSPLTVASSSYYIVLDIGALDFPSDIVVRRARNKIVKIVVSITLC